MTTINNYNLVVLVQEALHCRLGGPSDVASEAGPVTSPPEGVALAVLLGEDQQDLRREQMQGEAELGRSSSSAGRRRFLASCLLSAAMKS